MILLSGDTHGSIDFRKLGNGDIISRFGRLPEVVIVLGDFGCPWSNDPQNKEDLYLAKWYFQKPYIVLVIPGNHENYGRIMQMPEDSVFGAKCRKYTDNIFIIDKNEILTIEGKTFYCFGGAMSVDKAQRVPYISWWPEEDANTKDQYDMKTRISYVKGVDYVLTHTCPDRVANNMFTMFSNHYYDACPTRKILDFLDENIQFKHWYFGHWHEDREFQERYTCLYKNLIEVK
jgi:predicted MPP superfamily phosphohydrolase